MTDTGKTDRRERTYRSILAAAAALIGHEEGMSVRIEQICAEAGISRGTFYNYFQSLDELFAALAQDLNHAFNVAVLRAAAEKESCAERAYFALYHYLDRANRDPVWGWTMVHLSTHGPLFGEETSSAALADIELGIARGEFDIRDASFGRDMALGTCLAAIRSQLAGERQVGYSGEAARYILRGLGVPEQRIAAIVATPVEPLEITSCASPQDA